MVYLEGVYWDLDGTIANTELEAHLPAFNESFKDLNINWYWDDKTYIELLKINGGRKRIEHFSNVKGFNFSRELIIEIHKRKQIHYLNFVKRGAVTLKTGVLRLIQELADRKIRQFIVTSSSRIQVDLLIEILFKNIKPFEFFITSEDVDSLKPHPNPYLKAINLSGISNKNSIVFEDSIPGIKSSKTANLPTICVQSNIPIEISSELKLDMLISSIGDTRTRTKILNGPLLSSKCVDYKFLNDFLNII